MKPKRVPRSKTTQAGVSFWPSAALLAAGTFFFYLPLWRNGFVTWDDPVVIVDNPHLRSLDGDFFHWAFTTFLTGNWIPLTWFSLALDHQVYGLIPQGYHFTNLIVHTLNSFLVLVLVHRFLDLVKKDEKVNAPAAFLTALLFALHPIHVESVAWASERKDVLCAFFYLATLIAYLRYAADPLKITARLWACGGLFALALMAKPMAVTLPVVLLLLDLWPLKRWKKGEWKKSLLEKVPFFLLALVCGLITLLAQGEAQAFPTATGLTTAFRVMNAFRALVLYVGKMILPIGLVPFYPIPRTADYFYYRVNDLAILLVIGSLLFAWTQRRKMPAVLTALLFYLITLMPVLGLVEVGSQSMADRYTYLPSLALFLPLGWGLAFGLKERTGLRRVLTLVLAIVLGTLTWNQLAVWQDPIHFWECVTQNFPGQSQVAHKNLGDAYYQAGRYPEALRQYDTALLIPPAEAYTHNGRGMAWFALGSVDDAIQEFKTAVELKPDYALAHYNLWMAYRKKGMKAEALAEIQKETRLDPQQADGFAALGVSYAETGRSSLAVDAFQQAIDRDPANSQYPLDLASTYQQTRQWAQAVNWYQKVLELDPRSATAWFGLGDTYLSVGNFAGAVSALKKADELTPGDKNVKEKLQEAMGRLNSFSKP